MSYKVFLSHSSNDQGLITTLTNILYRFGIEVFVAEWYLSPGQIISEKVFKEIDKSDCVVALLTHAGTRSNWVQMEIGYALKAPKAVIPLVEKGVSDKELAALQGRDYILYDSTQPQQALDRLTTYVSALKLQKEESETTMLVVGSIALLLLLLAGTAGSQKR